MTGTFEDDLVSAFKIQVVMICVILVQQNVHSGCFLKVKENKHAFGKVLRSPANPTNFISS